MTRKLRRNYSLSVVVPFIAILILLIAAAVLAQTSGAGQTSGKANAGLDPTGTSVSAQAERPLTPSADGAARSPVGRSRTKRHGARPMDGNPLFLPAVGYDSGGNDNYDAPRAAAVADVNGDGKPDIVVANYNSGTVSVLLGNGDGTFQPTVVYNLGGYNPNGLVIADVNGDGKPDLVVWGSWNSPGVAVLLGSGDGTFLPAVTYDVGAGPAFDVAIADVNGDGKPDLIVAVWYTPTDSYGYVAVLLGNGDGTFLPAATYRAGLGPNSVAAADVNGDGIPDLLVANSGPASNTVSVLLGNGDGTFQPAVSYGSGGSLPQSIAVADVNGDNKPDLIVANLGGGDNGDGAVGVLLGNGDGTFHLAVAYDSGGGNARGVAIADVDGDGKPDILVTNLLFPGPVGVLLGNGDGTFQPTVTYGSGGYLPISIIAADVNGDGNIDLVVLDESGGNNNDGQVGVLLNNSPLRTPTTSTLSSSLNPSAYGQVVTLTAAVSSPSGTPTGTVIFYDSSSSTVLGSVALASGSASLSTSSLPVGSRSITAAYQGSPGFRPSTSAPLIQVVTGTPTTTSMISSTNPSVYGQTVTFTAAVNSASGTPTGKVIFFDGSTAFGSAILANGSASIPVSSLAAGSHSITAAYQGLGAFESSTSVPLNQVVNPAVSITSLVSSANPARVRQRITYTATVTSQYGGAATGTVTFQDGGTAVARVSVTNNQAAYTTTYKSGGVHAITATYSGDANNVGSISAPLMEYVAVYASKTGLTTSGSPSQFGQPVTFTATVTSAHGAIPDGDLVTFYVGNTMLGSVALASGVAAYTTSTLAAGQHTIKAVYQGDAMYEISSAKVTQIVDKNATTTSLSSSLNPSHYRQSVTFTATVTSSWPETPTGRVAFNGPKTIGYATLSGGVATLTTRKLAVGTHPITAKYLGDADNATSTSGVLDQVVQ